MDIAIIGFGVVGSGAYETILDGKTSLRVKRILDLAVRPGMEDVMTTDYNEIINDPSISVVAESIGGLHPAREFVLRALARVVLLHIQRVEIGEIYVLNVDLPHLGGIVRVVQHKVEPLDKALFV